MTKEHVLSLLRREVQRAGSRKAYAKHIGVAESYVGYVLRGKVEPGPKILEPLGLVRVTSYEPAPR